MNATQRPPRCSRADFRSPNLHSPESRRTITDRSVEFVFDRLLSSMKGFMGYSLDSQTVVAVIGAGSMGAGIAQLAAQSGHAVRLHDTQAGVAAKALVRIAADLDRAVSRGKLAAAERDATLARIAAVDSLDALAGCGLVVEAIVERLEAKQALLGALEARLGAEAVLATNTSSISITAVAQGLQHPQRLIGWHFFNPATRMKLVEVIAGVETDTALARAMHALSRAWGKTSVDAPNTPGFIVNRVARPYYAEGLRLLAERIAPAAAIDRLMREAGGFAMGPFELMDLIGLDVNLSVTESVFQATAFDARYAPHVIQQELVRSGRLGRKSGRGFYAYGDGVAAPVVETVAPGDSGGTLEVASHLGLLAPLAQRLQAAGVHVTTHPGLPDETLAIGDTRIALTDGRTAAERSAGSALIVLDLARDFSTTTTLGAATSMAAAMQLPALAALLHAASIALIRLDDVAGLALMRTVCCLANEAAEVMTWTSTTAAAIDTAMCLGTAYPLGPLAWADALGATRVANVLANLQVHYGEARYRRAPMLSRAGFNGGRFHG
jgi:3-hydroxybutyryl-CoA dehydrogenase